MININCDMGEGLDNEHLLMPYINSCNIACGGHAGDTATMMKVTALAKEHNVKVGAHPSYPDKENFGRVSVEMNQEDLIQSIQEQLKAFNIVLENIDLPLHHIKAHGALYNDIAKDAALANVFLSAIFEYKTICSIYVPYHSAIELEAKSNGFKVIYEGFADRNYNDDYTLVNRKYPNAVMTDESEIVKRIEEISKTGKLTSVNGKQLPYNAQTFCVHSDTANAVEIVRAISEYFSE